MERSVLKSLRDFAENELKEKRADRVVVCRAKMKQWLRRGQLPDLRVRKIEGANYFVCVLRGDELRIYSMNGHGLLLGAVDFKGAEGIRAWMGLSKGTKIIFRLPP